MKQPHLYSGLIVVMCLLGWPGLAEARKIVPLAPAIEPSVAQGLRDRFQNAVALGVKADEVIPAAEVRSRLESLPHLASCAGGACIKSVAASLEAMVVLVTHIEQSGKNYTINVQAYSASGAALGKGAQERCEVCTVHEAELTITKATRQAMDSINSAASPAPTPPVAAPPPTKPLPNQRPGLDEEEPGMLRQTKVEAKATTPVTTPTPTPAATPAPASGVLAPKLSASPTADSSTITIWGGAKLSTKFPYRLAGTISFAVAAALLIPTIIFSVYGALDSQPTCDKPDPTHSCTEIYSGNTGPAVAFGVLAGLGAAAGGLLYYFDYRVRKAPRLTLAPSANGFAAAANFSF